MQRYKASAGIEVYKRNRLASCRCYDFLNKSSFISYVAKHFFEEIWSRDLVLGAKTKDDDVLFTMIERKTREFLVMPLVNKNAATDLNALYSVRDLYSDHFNEVFKTITTDNGSEFADLTALKEVADTLIYYAHPYTSCEKGSVERHNGLIHRFIPKGKRIDGFSNQEIADVETWCKAFLAGF